MFCTVLPYSNIHRGKSWYLLLAAVLKEKRDQSVKGSKAEMPSII